MRNNNNHSRIDDDDDDVSDAVAAVASLTISDISYTPFCTTTRASL